MRYTTVILCSFFFFFNDTATTEIYTLSLHDALPISGRARTETLKLARTGATLVAWSDDAYPPALRHIAQPPLVLAVRGSLGGPDEPAIAIVGARRASEYGRHMAEELARRLAQAGVTVGSGLAAGVDAAAHHAAPAAGGR